MPMIKRFEDLQSWQKARQLANMIYDLTDHPHFAKDFQLRDQIRDAAGSVMHNGVSELVQWRVSAIVLQSCTSTNYRTTELSHYRTIELENQERLTCKRSYTVVT